MKPILILTTILIGIAFYGLALGEEELNGQLHVDFPKEEALYTESHGFDMAASVEPNLCNYCIKNFDPSQCLEICNDIIIYE